MKKTIVTLMVIMVILFTFGISVNAEENAIESNIRAELEVLDLYDYLVEHMSYDYAKLALLEAITF